MKMSKFKGTSVLAALSFGLAAAATGALAEDVPSWCGPNQATLALLDGFGGNSWRLVTTASVSVLP